MSFSDADETELRFVTINQNEMTGQIGTKLTLNEDLSATLEFSAKGRRPLTLRVPFSPANPDEGAKLHVRMKSKEVVRAYSEGEEAARWFSEVLNESVVLARNCETVLTVPITYADKLELPRSQSDQRPGWQKDCNLHVVSVESIRALKSEAQKRNPAVKCDPYHMRPNIVIGGEGKQLPAYYEDQLRILRVRNQLFRLITFAKRCQVITYDYEAGHRNLDDMEPLASVNRLRTQEDIGPIFGLFM